MSFNTYISTIPLHSEDSFTILNPQGSGQAINSHPTEYTLSGGKSRQYMKQWLFSSPGTEEEWRKMQIYKEAPGSMTTPDEDEEVVRCDQEFDFGFDCEDSPDNESVPEGNNISVSTTGTGASLNSLGWEVVGTSNTKSGHQKKSSRSRLHKLSTFWRDRASSYSKQ